MKLDYAFLLQILMLASSMVGLACGIYLYRMDKPKRFKLAKTLKPVVHAKLAETKKEKASPSAQELKDMGDKLVEFMEESE